MTGHHSVAFVDESHLKGPESAGFYLLAAVIVDQDDADQARSAMRDAVGTDFFHATTLHHRARFRVVEDALDVVSAHAGWVHIVTHAPLDVGKRNRTAALPQPAPAGTQPATRARRADGQPRRRPRPGRARHQRHPRPAHLPPAGPRKHHQPTHGTPAPAQPSRDEGLWMADVAAWAAQRVLRSDDPV